MNGAKQLYQITLPTPFAIGDVHVYLLVEEMITLIDAGIYTEEAWQSFTDQLSNLGMQVEQIDQIILTHHHPDHTGLISYFNKSVKVAAHPDVDVWLKHDESYFTSYICFFKKAFLKWGVPNEKWTNPSLLKGSLRYAGRGEVSIPLKHLDQVPGHDEWVVLYTPGHAQTHISLFHEKDKVLIGGDHLLQNTRSNPLLESPYGSENKRTKPLVQYRKSLRELKRFGIHQVYPGHGPMITEVNAFIQERLDEHEQRSRIVKSILHEKPQTAYALSRRLYPKQTSDQLLLVLSQTIGLLDLLEEDGEITKIVHNGAYVYKPMKYIDYKK